MKKKDLEAIKALSVEDLEKKLGELKEEIFALRFQHATNQLDNPLRIASVRKEIAVVMTPKRKEKRLI